MDTADIPSETSADKAPAPSRFGALKVALPVAALLAAVYATTVAIAVSVPDQTDYAQASVLKHELLAADDAKKIVLVGGSNLAYGVDSQAIKAATQCRVVNMGMNGYFGVRFMLQEVKPYLHEGDIIVIAWEYDSFYKSVDGTSTDLLMVSKANHEAFGYLSTGQKLAMLSQFPYVAQQKVIRLMGDGAKGLAMLAGARDSLDATGITEIETLGNFTQDGDLTGHLNRTWEDGIEDGLDMSTLPMDQQILPLMEEFVREMNARGVKVMISWSPIVDYFYEKHKTEVERLNAEMTAIPEFNIPRPARDYVFPASQHFDTVFHLNKEGRAIRSDMLTQDILTQFGDDARCNTPS